MRNIQIENISYNELLVGFQEILKKALNNQKSQSNLDDVFHTRADTAILLKVTLATLNNWSKKRVLIPFALGNRIYYRKSDILEAMKRVKN